MKGMGGMTTTGTTTTKKMGMGKRLLTEANPAIRGAN